LNVGEQGEAMVDLKNKTVLLIGAGPRIIGQSAECDEGAVAAARALVSQGCRIITVNSNPDAVMTAPDWALHSYMEPLTGANLAQIIGMEKPDAVLPTFAGRQGLHLAAELAHEGVLAQHQTTLWSMSVQTLQRLLNRDTLNTALNQIGLSTPSIFVLENAAAAAQKAHELGFPVVLRRTQTELLPDGVLIYNQDELSQYAAPVAGENSTAVSIEASLLAWQQVELEILRDAAGESLVVGGVEYLDTAGIHPGDAIAVCPPQSLSAELIQLLAGHAESIVAHLDIVGNATIRFACRPSDDAVLVLAVHPRYTRTSALVSRVADVPLAALSAMLAAGFPLKELPEGFSRPRGGPADSLTAGKSPVAVKWPCWDFGRLDAADRLGTQMKAVGQHLGYGHDFKEALQKAARAAAGNDLGLGDTREFEKLAPEELLSALSTPTSRRLPMVCEALRRGTSLSELHRLTHIAPWFLDQIKALMDTEALLRQQQGRTPSSEVLGQAKKSGFSDTCLAALLQMPAETLAGLLADNGFQSQWQSLTADGNILRFSTFDGGRELPTTKGGQKVLMIGCGAYRIGQGPECDYGICQAVEGARAQNFDPVVLNCNLAGITTGRTMVPSCYCDPITVENILSIIDRESPTGVILQFAGIRANPLATELAGCGVRVLGAAPQSLQLIADRPAFKTRMRALGIPQPADAIARSIEEARSAATEIGFPVQVRPIPSEEAGPVAIIQDESELQRYLESFGPETGFPLMVEQFLEYAIEAQAETLCDGQSAHVAAVMEHIELAGVHAGDSAYVLPPYSIAPRHVETMVEYCQKVATALQIKGLLNLRFAVYRDTVYLLEAQCNVSRNLAVVDRIYHTSLAAMATRLMLGARLGDLSMPSAAPTRVSVRAAVFPFTVFNTEDPLLGPRMRSIGQALSMEETFGLAYFKAQEAAATPLPTQGTVLITVTDEDKASILEPARIFQELGFNIMATRGTHDALATNGIQSQLVRKLGFGRPNLLDEIKNGNVQVVINTPTGGQGQIDDSVIRKTAITYRVANMTTPASALAAAKGIAARRKGKNTIAALPCGC
jgi:carbamoyl-phosphate synthase large subunit